MPLSEPDPKKLQELTEVFRAAGVDDPEVWAESELSEGIPQLAVFSFATAMWKGVVSEEDDSWIDRYVQDASEDPDGICSQAGLALRRMLDLGVPRSEIVDLVRVLQYDTLFHVASMLDGSLIEDVPVTDWTLHQVDEQGRPVAIIQGLHEILLSLDPTKREMFPRETSADTTEQ